MKQKYWIVPVLFAFLLGACDSMLEEDPKSFLTSDTYYKTPAQLNAGVLSAYNALQQVISGTQNQWWAVLGNASDQEKSDPTEVSNARLPDFIYWTAESPIRSEFGWQNLPVAIYRANVIIERAPDVEMAQQERDAIVGEAKFLRALSYLNLDKGYSSGNQLTDLSAPLFLTETDHLNAATASRATVAEVHAQILKDLTEAEASLPLVPSVRGRATKGAARMALADFFLWRSSFYKQNEWQQASDWAKKVIDSGQYSLLTTGWFNNWNPNAKADNDEAIFFLVATGTPGRQNTRFGNLHRPRSLGFDGGGGFGTNQVTPWLLSSFADGDIRGRVGPISVPTGTPNDTVAYIDFACSTNIIKLPGFVPGISGGTCGPVTPMPFKFRPTSLNNNDGDVDVPVYRYAETLLMYAEAQNELGNSAVAAQYINMVRARARLGATGQEHRAEPADIPVMGKQQMRDAVYMERNWEMAHEMKRWWDLIRRNSLEPGFWYNSLSQHDPNSTALRPDLEQQQYLMRFPVPKREIDLNENLVQNPGY